jgi:hypothetical protein
LKNSAARREVVTIYFYLRVLMKQASGLPFRKAMTQKKRKASSCHEARHAAALALVIWYLMQPPLPYHAHPTTPRIAAGPFSGWTIAKTFPTQKECEARRGNPWDRCIASDDPRLKAKQDTSLFNLGHSSPD